MNWYCRVALKHPIHGPYHDREYGFPLKREEELLERLALEVFQAGLSWEITLKKRAETVRASPRFDANRVAPYKAADISRLLKNPGIIRNRLKIKSIVENARRIREMRETHGGFAAFLAQNHPKTKKEWVRLFKTTFVFTGGEIVNEFLMSIGYLPGAHHPRCVVHRRIKKKHTLPWEQAKKKGFKY